jgi:hypothetical protein
MTHQTWQYLAMVAISLNILQYAWQIDTIVYKKSGASVSVTAFASAVGIEAVNILYGKSVGNELFAANGVVCLVGQLLVLGILAQHKTVKKWERGVYAAWIVMVVAVTILPFKNALQLAASGLNFLGSIAQPVELAAGKGTGSLSIVALASSLVSAAILTGYCHVNKFWGPELGLAVFTLYQACNIGLWFYKSQKGDEKL